jgi:hypothetical protein
MEHTVAKWRPVIAYDLVDSLSFHTGSVWRDTRLSEVACEHGDDNAIQSDVTLTENPERITKLNLRTASFLITRLTYAGFLDDRRWLAKPLPAVDLACLLASLWLVDMETRWGVFRASNTAPGFELT